ncbi:MAG: succinate--CoA ligase subunit alpha [Planctomycetes bacterium]|nr:succinate--CoA ligase subunit alpha [Planctomycetota bacterium]
MSILVDKNTRVVVQGITGSAGSFHAKQMLEYGTKVVAGVTPGKGGQRFEDRVPVYDSVEEAVKNEGADASVLFVPPALCADSICEACDAGIKLAVCITEGIPILDELKFRNYIGNKMRLIGPNCPGIITAGETKLGIMPGYIHKKGRVGVISRSGTLTYEAVWQLSNVGLGQTTCIGIGGDPIIGLKYIDLLELFRSDIETEAVVLIGEIGGQDEEMAAAFIKESKYPKPVITFIGGQTAPKGKRMGHAGAIIEGGKGTAQGKIQALEDAGVTVCKSPADIGETAAKILR